MLDAIFEHFISLLEMNAVRAALVTLVVLVSIYIFFLW